MNYLALESLLIERLESLDTFSDVLSGEQLSKVTEENLSTPAAHVVYLGDAIANTAQGGSFNKVTQRWMVVIAVQSFDGSDTLSDAGELMGSVFEALQGWKPNSELDFTPLRRENAGTQPLYRNGYGYFPLLFTSTLTIKGKRT